MSVPNESPGGAEVLSQSEVERLLAQVTEQESNSSAVKQAGDNAKHAGERVQPYDFRHPVFLSPGEMRRLRARHEEFIRALAARFSIYLRLEFALQMLKLETISYQKFAGALPNPTHISLFKVEPLRGIGVLDIHPRLGLTMVDRLLGGPAHSIAADHHLSEIEMALLDQSVQLILGEWCNQWTGVQELRAALLGHETSGQFLQTSPHDTIMLVLTLEAKLGDCLESIRIALPSSTLEPLIRKLGQITETVGQDSRVVPASAKWNRNFDDVPVPVTAMWDDLVLTARELASLKPGDVLPLDPRSTRQVKLRLASIPKFEGQLGTAAGKWAVAVTGATNSVED
jgi:flagellar motor switch protein FliM